MLQIPPPKLMSSVRPCETTSTSEQSTKINQVLSENTALRAQVESLTSQNELLTSQLESLNDTLSACTAELDRANTSLKDRGHGCMTCARIVAYRSGYAKGVIDQMHDRALMVPCQAHSHKQPVSDSSSRPVGDSSDGDTNAPRNSVQALLDASQLPESSDPSA